MHRCIVHFENGSKRKLIFVTTSRRTLQELLIFQETDALSIALSLCMIQKTTK